MSTVETIINKIISTLFALWPQPRPHESKLKNVKLVAHRGVHENHVARENSIESFRLAIENKIWGIELDVRFTTDNIAVIHHDPIPQVTFAKLKQLDPNILTLKQVISECAKQVHLFIEIKEDLHNRPQPIAALKAELESLTPVKDFHLLCLEPQYLEVFNFIDKKALMDVMWLNPKYIFNLNKGLQHGAISGHFLFFKTTEISHLHERSCKVGVGFIDSRNSLYREINREVDYIFTNHPLRLNGYLHLQN